MFPNLHRAPDKVSISVESDGSFASASARSQDHLVWELSDVRVTLATTPEGALAISANSSDALRGISLRWAHRFAPGVSFLGDTWERSYGDLGWQEDGFLRAMPWYFLANRGEQTAGYGVQTGGGGLACWRADREGVTLELDVRSGGRGVELGQRELGVATIVQRLPRVGESPFEAAKALCAALCPAPSAPTAPIIGHNDWYWLYGRNSEALILEATERMVELFPDNSPTRPWSVIDDGWQETGSGSLANSNGGPWSASAAAFPDMESLAQKIRGLGARPGIWLRPLLTKTEVPASWRLRNPRPADAAAGQVLDPSVPEVLGLVRADILRLRSWGYEMIKHDYTTFDVAGRWGNEMDSPHPGFTSDGWTFADRSRTTAEILRTLYATIREAAGNDAMVMGCNTVGHLAAGLVDIQRIGDDTSAFDWDRTRKMGVNTLAFRGVQHESFFAADADCVPISPHIPWNLSAAWMNLVAQSGTPLFLSIDPAACGKTQQRAIRHAMAEALRGGAVAEPLDWFNNKTPNLWHFSGASRETRFEWDGVTCPPEELAGAVPMEGHSPGISAEGARYLDSDKQAHLSFNLPSP